ncbi:hypothetical protein [uncultured Proteiniphilum sp.]|uniref:hypothetical protein n=1 Tax=uncultured Proteiniphilum sp. TaxID=497637 RepID=UPI002636F327|nr:hypothetical protein [uncultured Proteiniphilum sp.]
MNTAELLNIRLYNQLLSTHHMKEPHEIVSWMGAMQSQALDQAKWAIGAASIISFHQILTKFATIT